MMCRYAISGPYKSHFACFACRKCFKQPPIADWLAVRDRGHAFNELRRLSSCSQGLNRREQEIGFRLAELGAEYREAIHKCPECDLPMIDMGLDFKPPRQSNFKAWRTIQGLYHAGHAFHTCGCDGPGFIPKTPAGYRQYLLDRKQLYADQLQAAQRSTELCPDRKREAAVYWAARIAAIEGEMLATT